MTNTLLFFRDQENTNKWTFVRVLFEYGISMFSSNWWRKVLSQAEGIMDRVWQQQQPGAALTSQTWLKVLRERPALSFPPARGVTVILDPFTEICHIYNLPNWTISPSMPVSASAVECGWKQTNCGRSRGSSELLLPLWRVCLTHSCRKWQTAALNGWDSVDLLWLTAIMPAQ